jgi:hypothetical protein
MGGAGRGVVAWRVPPGPTTGGHAAPLAAEGAPVGAVRLMRDAGLKPEVVPHRSVPSAVTGMPTPSSVATCAASTGVGGWFRDGTLATRSRSA